MTSIGTITVDNNDSKSNMYLPIVDGGGGMASAPGEVVAGGPVIVDGVGLPPAMEKNCTFVLGGIDATHVGKKFR